MQKKEDQKVVFVSLSIHTKLEHEEHTKKIKNPDKKEHEDLHYPNFRNLAQKL